MPPLNRTFRVGSQLFVNPEDTPYTLRPAIEQMARAGFKLIRLFLPWSDLEPVQGEYRWESFDFVFNEAHPLGMQVVPTLLAVSPPGWMRVTNGLQDVANLDDDDFFRQALAHVRVVVARFRNHPALDSWILWNEPSRVLPENSPETTAKFQEFLRRRYADDIGAYNRAHFVPEGSFAHVAPPGLQQGGFVSHRAKVEWREFEVENLVEKLTAIGAAVRAVDPDHPIHVNPHRVHEVFDGGQSIWREGGTVDFLGCSAHPAWHSVHFPRERYPESVGMFSDLMRSATRAPDRYFWVTELQGGTTLLSGVVPLAADPGEARLWLWQGIAAGAKAVVYWCVHGRTDGVEAGEWDLLDLRGRPTPQLRAISAVVRGLEPHLPLLEAARPPRPDLGIVTSEPAMILDLVEGRGDAPADPRNRSKTANAMAGAYLLAADLSLECEFYDLARLRSTPVEALPPVLFLPGLVVVDGETVDFLQTAVESGRAIFGDGFFAWKDGNGRLASDRWDAADRLWGAVCAGYEAVADGAALSMSAGGDLPAWFVRALLEPAENTEVVGRWADGSPAATRTRHGQGMACRVGTLVFQRYFVHADPRVKNWFADQLRGAAFPAAPRTDPVQGLRLRRLDLDDGHLVIVLNATEAERTVNVRAARGGGVIPLRVPARDAVIRHFPA